MGEAAIQPPPKQSAAAVHKKEVYEELIKAKTQVNNFQNGFEKKQTFYNILKAFSSDTPQSIKRQNRFGKKHDGKIYTQLWIEIGQSEKRKHKTGIVDQSVPRA